MDDKTIADALALARSRFINRVLAPPGLDDEEVDKALDALTAALEQAQARVVDQLQALLRAQCGYEVRLDDRDRWYDLGWVLANKDCDNSDRARAMHFARSLAKAFGQEFALWSGRFKATQERQEALRRRRAFRAETRRQEQRKEGERSLSHKSQGAEDRP